ncbi:hypothetical protein J437_LFUL007392 [Ladona fulva]|uniref:Peptidase aspartic putative domain-containing protein n=1 Tax=Ladona fulva TaxID=123851 RepID=A0A8K0K2K0_LADFU|nr:hypothetical protein J437_LFUL007392 [Ladona fulva]
MTVFGVNDRGILGRDELKRHPDPASSTGSTPPLSALVASTSLYLANPTSHRPTVLLATVLVKVIGPNGNYVLARALVDQCAQLSFISESLCQRLRLKERSTFQKVLGLDGCRQAVSRKAVFFTLKPYFESKFSSIVDAYVIKSVSSYTPASNILSSEWEHLHDLTLADPEFREAKEIDLLLSAAVHAQIMEGEIKKGKPGEPIAMLTSLGWMLSGDAKMQPHDNQNSIVHHCQEESLNKLLSRFWKQEELQIPNKILTPDEQECEELFLSSYRRHISGRYIIRLPLKDGETAETKQLGSSYFPALRMQTQMERKFQCDGEFKKRY